VVQTSEEFSIFLSYILQEGMVSSSQMPLMADTTIVLPHPLHGGSFLWQCCFS